MPPDNTSGMRGDIDLSQSVENEHLCMKLTTALRLPTARTDIADSVKSVFLSSNVLTGFGQPASTFSAYRKKTAARPCQFHQPQNINAQGGPGIAAILDLLRGSDDPEADRRNFMKAQIIFWLMGAIDGHAKNFQHLSQPRRAVPHGAHA